MRTCAADMSLIVEAQAQECQSQGELQVHRFTKKCWRGRRMFNSVSCRWLCQALGTGTIMTALRAEDCSILLLSNGELGAFSISSLFVFWVNTCSLECAWSHAHSQERKCLRFAMTQAALNNRHHVSAAT